MADKVGTSHGSPARPPAQDERGVFDRFASAATSFSSRPTFFMACVLLVVVWAPSILVIRNADTWQLIINTTTTIFTFIMVALLQNAAQRFENSTNAKLNAIAAALGDFMAVSAETLSADGADDQSTDLLHHADELRRAVGAENRVGA